MKILILLILSSILFSCCTQKNNIDKINEESTINNRIIGFIVETESSEDSNLSEECPFLIRTKTYSGKNITMYPINLDDKFKKDGIPIRFTYSISRAMQPKNCNCNQVVSVSDVTILRK